MLTVQVPVLPSTGNGSCGSSSMTNGSVDSGGHDPVGVSPYLCRFHGGWGFGNGGTSVSIKWAFIVCIRSEFTEGNRVPSNIFYEGFAEEKCSNVFCWIQSKSKCKTTPESATASMPKFFFSRRLLKGLNSSSNGDKAGSVPVNWSDEPQILKNQDVNSVLSKFRDLNLGENIEQVPLDQKDDMILTLVHQIKDLDGQERVGSPESYANCQESLLAMIEREENQPL